MEDFPYIISGLFMYYTFHHFQLLCVTLTELLLLLNIWLHIYYHNFRGSKIQAECQ